MTEDPLNGLKQLLCIYCLGTGMMEIVMPDTSREPWPCLYCDAGSRIRDARNSGEFQAAPGTTEHPETDL